MRNILYVLAGLALFFTSCKKEVRTFSVDETIQQMKADPDMKDLYNASKGWVIHTYIDVAKKQLDSAATLSYLTNLKSFEHTRLRSVAQKVKDRYHLSAYPVQIAKEMVRTTLKSFIETERGFYEKQAAGARTEEPIDILLPPSPGPDCRKYLIADVSRCDEEMVIDTAFALLGLASGPWTYFVMQTGAFIKHSRCVDSAWEAYRRCLAQQEIYIDPRPEPQMELWDPATGEVVIIYFTPL